MHRLFSAVLAAAFGCAGATVEFRPEYQRSGPTGEVVAADRASAAAPFRELRAARGAYASAHVVVGVEQPGPYKLEVSFPAPSRGLAVELFREWQHLVPAANQHYPDALIPVRSPVSGSLPDPENRIAGQTAQSFWVDVWVPADAQPGDYPLRAEVEAAGRKAVATLTVRVLGAVVPAEDAVVMDHNSYGTNWFASRYPKTAKKSVPFFASPAFFDLIHAHHRVFYEHRGLYHQLGYGHGGKVGPEFAPVLAGEGRSRRIASWELFDRHYGPLLDGSAFAKTRRGARPLSYVYLPINPEWPAQFLHWGEPGHEAEFVNVVGEMERHFREKGWTSTRFEMFFNHKKRYKAFPWDGDETRFPEDLPYYKEYARLLRKAVPMDSPVKFTFRADASWMMERQFRELAGVVDFWICGGGMLSWYPESVAMLRARGDTVWAYGGTPPVTDSASAVSLDGLRAWMQGVQGFVRWQTVDPGPDPWFALEGGAETLVYPGDRFGLGEPLPSIRLKLQRNAMQDLALLDKLSANRVDEVRRETASRFNRSRIEDWWAPRPAFADGNPADWNNADIGDAPYPARRLFEKLDADAWQRVRSYAFELAGRGI